MTLLQDIASQRLLTALLLAEVLMYEDDAFMSNYAAKMTEAVGTAYPVYKEVLALEATVTRVQSSLVRGVAVVKGQVQTKL